MVIGILGVGHLASAMLRGFLASGLCAADVLLSPRGQARALSAQLGTPLAADNRDLVERSEQVILAVRPAHAAAAVAGLPWREDQIVVSVCAGVTMAKLPVAPARIVRAMPLVSAEFNASPTAFYPPCAKARELLGRLGPTIPLDSEAEFELASIDGAVFGWAHDLIRQTVDWSVARGARPEIMRELIARAFIAAGRMVCERGEPIETLLCELATPGGITELGLKVLSERGQPAAWNAACGAVLERLTGQQGDHGAPNSD